MNRELKPLYAVLTSLSLGLAAVALMPAGKLSAMPSPKPPYFSTWQSLYPGSLSDDHVVNGTGTACQLCHQQTSGGDGWNAYGWKVRELILGGNSIAPALLLAQPFDSDTDPTASTNLDEINADTQPGWTEGANNTIFFENGGTLQNQNPPAAILGELDPSQEPGVAYCFGNSASGNPCPCNNDNDGTVPLGGCRHDDSTAGARLDASGVASVTGDTLVLEGSRGPASNSTLFFQANNNLDGAGVFLGDGIRCAGGGLIRLKVKTTDASGSADSSPAVISARSATFGHTIVAGETLQYQWWIRDPGGSPCGNENNTSNGYQITWGA